MSQPPFEMPDLPQDRTQAITPPTDKTQIAADRTQVFQPLPGINATQTIAPTQCAVCKQHNPPGEIYCVECGFVLNTVMEVQEPAESADLPALRDSASGREHLLKEGPNTIGREGADVLLSDNRISRKHAQITLAPDGAWLEDLGSTNGTKLNGVRLSPGERAKVEHDATLSFGGVELKLNLPARTAAVVESAEEAAQDATAVATEAAPELAQTGADLQVTLTNTTEPQLNQTIALAPEPKSVGRRPENDLVIPNPYVSGRHALLEIEGAAAFVTDLGSTNGTSLNGKALEANQRTALNDGDEVTFGQTTFKVSVIELAPPVADEAGSIEPEADHPLVRDGVEPETLEAREGETQ